MLEVCFNDSVKGALAMAQTCSSKTIAKSVAIIDGEKLSWFRRRKFLKEYEKKQKELDEQAIHLESKHDDIVGIFPLLSIGDISSEEGQKNLIFRLINDDKQAAEQYWQNCVSDLEKLKDRSSKGEPIRIWADSSPDAACGFLYVCNLLKDSDCPVTVVKLPEAVKRADNVTVRYRGWGEVEPQLFGSFAEECSVILDKETILKYAKEWQTLREENSPLRAVKDGKVISVGKDYYDDIIRGEFPEKSCRIAEIIGNVLGKHQLPVSDWLIAERIRIFIAGGELHVIEENDKHFYGTVVEKA